MSGTLSRPDLSGLTGRFDLAVRAGLVLASGLATALEAPSPVRTVLALLALAGLGDLVIRSQPVGGRRAVAATVGGALAGAMAVGLVLNLVPSGLTNIGWGAGLSAVGLAVLAVSTASTARRGQQLRPRPRPGRALRLDGVWYAGAIVLVLAGLTMAVTVTGRAERPPVQLGAIRTPGNAVAITISSADDAGPFDLWLVDGRTEKILRTAFSVSAREPFQISLQRFGNREMRVSLRNAGSTEDLRYVIVNPGG